MSQPDVSLPLTRRAVLGSLPWAVLAPGAVAQGAGAAPGPKELRVAFPSPETTFDPAAAGDIYSRGVLAHIFEGLYGYDHLARPPKIVPVLADGMPEVSADFRTWTVRVRRGVFFSDHPVFGGKPREVTAHDLAYGIRRIADPASKSPIASDVFDLGLVGLKELSERATASRKPFDYDAPIEGLQVLDRHTIRFVAATPRPRLIELLTLGSALGAQAREVVEHHGANIGANPIGTGPFRLAKWVRATRIELERNPQFRDERWHAEPAAGDAEGQAMLAKFKGRRLPLVDRVIVQVIPESQPLWLSFLNGDLDYVNVPGEFVEQAVPNGELAPNLARKGVRYLRTLRPDMAVLYFNMDDKLVGGMEPRQVALRRAIALGYDVPREIAVARRHQAIPAQSPLMPGTSGYDPTFRSEMGEFDPLRAQALLDTWGWVDKDGDGWREDAAGRPLKLTVATEPDQTYRTYNEIFRRSMQTLGIQVEYRTQQWPENYKQALAGSLQMWMLGNSATVPDGLGALALYYGPQAGSNNFARFRLPAFDRVYEQLLALPDGPEREALFREAKRLAVAWMPYKVLVHRYANDLVHPWADGYRRGVFWLGVWQYIDVDVGRRQAALA